MSVIARWAMQIAALGPVCWACVPHPPIVQEEFRNGIYRLKVDDGICRSTYQFNFKDGLEHQYMRGHCPWATGSKYGGDP